VKEVSSNKFGETLLALILRMEAVNSSEKLENFNRTTARRYVPEDSTLNLTDSTEFSPEISASSILRSNETPKHSSTVLLQHVQYSSTLQDASIIVYDELVQMGEPDLCNRLGELDQLVTLPACIRDMPGSNLGQGTNYSDLYFSLFSSIDPLKGRVVS
jgi:hypothetical protein